MTWGTIACSSLSAIERIDQTSLFLTKGDQLGRWLQPDGLALPAETRRLHGLVGGGHQRVGLLDGERELLAPAVAGDRLEHERTVGDEQAA